MGNQHYAIVRTRIGATEPGLTTFEDKLTELFRKVDPLYPGWTGMWLVYGKDFANCELEIDMPDYVDKLSGILSGDAEIVWSWDHPQLSKERQGTDMERQRVWYIPGRETPGT